MKQFLNKERSAILHGKQIYRKKELSIDYLPANAEDMHQFIGDKGTASLSLGTLQIEIDIESRNLLYVWGYHPYFDWIPATIADIQAPLGSIVLTSDTELNKGISYSIDNSPTWQTLYDASTNHVAVTKGEIRLPQMQMVKIADDCIVELKENQLYSLILRLEFV